MRGIPAGFSDAGGLQRSHCSAGPTGDAGHRNGFCTAVVEWAFGTVVRACDDGRSHHTLMDSARCEDTRAAIHRPRFRSSRAGAGTPEKAVGIRRRRFQRNVETSHTGPRGLDQCTTWNFLVEVNIGAWSGKTAREMAEESGIIDFYNYVYMPFSQCAHSTWYHVGRYNSNPSESPLTKQLWMPRIADSTTYVCNLSSAYK